MLVIVQIPLYDPRGGAFRGREDRLDDPAWPNPEKKGAFIRSAGAVFKRGGGGLHGFFAEERLCNARRFIRFPKIGTLSTLELDDGANINKAVPRIAFRHFFMDGRHTAKLEIGFYLPRGDGSEAVIASNFTDFVEHILSQEITVGPDQTLARLGHSGPAVAAAIERATGRHPNMLQKLWRGMARRHPAEIKPGPPLVMAIAPSETFVGGLPPRPSLAEVGNCVISAWRRTYGDERYDLVLISEPERAKDLVRNLRLFINRSHAELVGAEYALRQISTVMKSSMSPKVAVQMEDELTTLQDARLTRLNSLARRIGKSARALRGGSKDDPVEIGGAVLGRIWGGRVDSVQERADILLDRLSRKTPHPAGGARVSGLRRQVFISYRRQDTGDLARRLAARLGDAFPKSHFFLDLVDLTPGGSWQQELEEAIARCSHVLALIGTEWAGNDALGGRRIDNPFDPVRLEVETALEAEKTLLPVIQAPASGPPGDMPGLLKRLHTHNWLTMADGPIDPLIPKFEAFLKSA